MNTEFKRLVLVLFLGMLAGCGLITDKSSEGYQNPVLPGDNPNPSVVLIGDTYYASATSNEWSPLFPIYKSDDLNNWKLVSYVFPGGAPDWAQQNFFAPELSYDEKQGKLYVYYTGRDKSNHKITIAVASADSPEGPFTDHGPLMISDNIETIDAFEIRDDNGDLYLIWKEVYFPGKPSVIYAQPITEDRRRVYGQKQELIRNDQEWEEAIVEGPCIFKRDDFFYLFYSAGNCCDIACNYKIGVARSKNLLGPWEKYEANPILSDNETWKCPGTGDVFKQGRNYFFLFHSYKTIGGDYIGREGLLEKIYWTDDDWPYFMFKSKLDSENHRIDYFDDFSKALNPCWQWRATQTLSYATGENGLMLAASTENDLLGNLLAQPVKSMDFEVTATLDLSNSGQDVNGGILLIGATHNGFGAPMAGLGITAGHDLIEVWITSGNEKHIFEAVPADPYGDLIKLRMNVKKGDRLQFSVSDGKKWDVIADSIDASGYVPWGMGFRWGVVSKGETNEFINIQNVELRNY
ncbi:family 43 glycosylhydrolase [Gaoshiqia sediminis]|uniref:Glycoside hydrolase family 43 protein n=1 Tax=Gaoshiqia sediminis TaxID=2986998 RepID=A0AA42CB50_9BACT|nr:family 43 glycosylhydrolase [Gaoshiqia sediminis]MCW0484490.1 glycoside hydrolase family 43 protein [Gaoshiqia sediminis]